MKLESFQDNNWMFVGMAKADVVPPDNNSHQWPGSYGWGFGTGVQEWKDGSCTYDNALKNLTKHWIAMLPSCHYICPLVNNFTSKYPSHKPGD
jgi:hypothetical protein